MTHPKPGWRSHAVVLGSFFTLVLPAIAAAALGYLWIVQRGFGVDIDARPEGWGDRLRNLLMLLPMIPLMVAAVLLAGIPWMWIASRCLPAADLEYYSQRRGPRWPWLSDWLEHLWQRMLEARRRRDARAGTP